MIQLERDGEVFLLRMQAGENRLNRPLLDALARALDEVEAYRGAAALVTTGEDRYYSTGLDLEWLAGVPPAEVRPFLEDLHRLLARVLAFPAITVASVNGHAFAAGALLALAHDFRVMRADRGYLCLPEVDLGTGRPLTPGMYALLDARLTRSTVHEALITGRRYNAHEALERGIVQEVAPEHEVRPRAVELARGFAGKDRATVGALKAGLFAPALAALGAALPDWAVGA
jgi:enoyl-CoA hydratase/carnithine racemase